jgi:hypothetical protein
VLASPQKRKTNVESYLDNTQAQGQVNYKQDDQVAATEQIIGFLGKDLPMSLVSRLIKKLNYDCYALLRMRPLSIPCAECSVVISCGKFDYDKSG